MYDPTKQSELIRFARVETGSTVIDVYPGDGDWTRLFSDAVGPEGRVYSFVTAAKAPAAHPVTAATSTATAPTARSTGTSATDDSTIQLVKEDLVVGKRAVEGGGVRVSTHVVETPVEEQVRLREENVRVERRPINRPLTGVGVDAFRERTLTASAMREEAFVGKEARVVEEIALRKKANERVETVRDTVRETKVDVEQVPGSATTTRSTTGGSVPGDDSLRDNAATRAVDRTLDTNLSGENPGRKV